MTTKRLLESMYLLLLGGLLASCALTADDPVQVREPSNEPATSAPTAAAAVEATAAATVETDPPEHPIGVRTVDGVGEFFDRRTGEVFVPRGNNYVRLDPQRLDSGETQMYHSVFDPGLYTPKEIETAFAEMAELEYNTVRVFLSQNTIGQGEGLSPEYLDNVADFLSIAQEHELFVILTIDWIPGGRYGRRLNQQCCDQFAMMNVNFMTEAGLAANKLFFQDFIQALLDRGAPTDLILSYQLRNELYFDTDFPPLSFEEGVVEALNGETYDMGDPAEKRRLADETMVYWLNEMRTAIRELDPTALVSSGFFWPKEPNPARGDDPRYINTAPAIHRSELDFVDLHAYPASELNLAEYVENFGMEGEQAKPIVMGEFGVSTASVGSVDSAATILMNWQAESCQYGFDGWILWTWDMFEFEDFYSGKSDQGQIGRALAPALRPDPCETTEFEFIERNLAPGAAVRASNFLAGEDPQLAVDGSAAAQWGAGAGPPQWIQLDLGETHTIEEIRLRVAQTPAGQTTHQLHVAGQEGSLQQVHTFQGETEDNQVLIFRPDSPLEEIQIIRVVTTQSPSWVAWKEIEVIGE
ncbi:MAG: cellulase family glycosylhydrolase [Anaerolineales bacterium]